jgi:hypothetical protein
MLNQAAIENRRVSLEESQVKQYKPGVWQCHYCVRRFTSETVFTRHMCEQKRRAHEIASPTGQAAWGLFNKWMKQRKFKEQSAAAFVDSRYYRAFLKFANFVVATGISKPQRFIQIMAEANITPDLWCRDACYKMYLDWIDKIEDPFEQVKSSIECLIDIASKEEVDYRTSFEHLGKQRILQLIVQRKLSPWFLLHSTKFQMMLKSMDKEDLKAFNQAINIGAWVDRLEEHKQIRDDIRFIIKEIEL